MKHRINDLGEKNIVGERIELTRKKLGMKQKELLVRLQLKGIDINSSGLSKIEGQVRHVSDFELLAFAEILNVNVLWLLTGKD